jgi:hypothetical protein
MAADATSTVFQKSIDSSGKSLAIFHHRDSHECRWFVPAPGQFGASAGRHSSPQLFRCCRSPMQRDAAWEQSGARQLCDGHDAVVVRIAGFDVCHRHTKRRTMVLNVRVNAEERALLEVTSNSA